MPKTVVIGGGIGGLATSILLAKAGYNVELFDQLDTLGGRARQFQTKGFTFDMGPSWYLMPGVFEHFFESIGENINEYVTLRRLNPAYKVFFESHQPVIVQGNLQADATTFESIEPGAGAALRAYVHRAGKTYQLATDSFLYTNFGSLRGLIKPEIIKSGPFMASVSAKSIDGYVSGFFKDQRLKQIMEYPMVFLGTSPFTAPALYHLLSYMDFEEGVFYPQGGIHRVIEALITIAKKCGVLLHTGKAVQSIDVTEGIAKGITLGDGQVVQADVVISNADVHFTETKLLAKDYQTYPTSYWQKRKNGPSALLLYLGIQGKLPLLQHHNLYFTDDWAANFKAIFDDKIWPKPASLYICKPSASDRSVAPIGHENLFVLIPLPAKLMTEAETNQLAARYFDQLKIILNEPGLDRRIVYKRLYTPNDFATDYNSWQGSALGLSHTLRQSALLRPRNKSKKVKNLYYVGGNTVPGIGLPMCLIGAELVYKHLAGDKSVGPVAQVRKLV